VDTDESPVPGQADIRLDGIGPGLRGRAQRLRAVFRREGSAAAM
jgi:hypothetical protein